MVAVSVIMPAFNSAAYIEEAIESVLRQTYRDHELIIVDDESVDDTRRIIERAQKHGRGRVRCFYQNNRGPGAARNHGMRHAQGEYIAFIDADDVWLPNKLAKQVALLEREPGTDLVYCDNYYVDAERRIVPGRIRRHPLPVGDITLQFFYRYFMFTSAVLARRAALEQTGAFREDIFVGEDYHYFLCLSYGRTTGLVQDKLFEKRVLQDSLSNQDYMLNARNDLMLLTDFIRDHPEFHRRHRQVIARQLGNYYFTVGYRCLRDGRNALSVRYLLRSLRYRKMLKAVKCLAMTPFPYDFIRFAKNRLAGKAYDYASPGEEE